MIDFLYTNIGRGHPHYLDGIVEVLPAERVGNITDVFAVSSATGRIAWRAVRAAYYAGARGDLLSSAYNRLRSNVDYNRPGLAQQMLGSGIARHFREHQLLIVAHPLLVAIMKEGVHLVYQHGEVVAPRDSLVSGKHRIVVPLTQTADTFVRAGFSSDRIFVSGLCIEPALAVMADHALAERSKRYSRQAPLCGAFFSSGAEPRAHVDAITAAALSVHSRGGRAVVFASSGGGLERRMRTSYETARLTLRTAVSLADLPKEHIGTLLCTFSDRQELNAVTATMFAEFDYFVAPPHERTNWALGLGLPMYVVDPPLGSFAPLNRALLMNAGVAKPLGSRLDAQTFANTLEVHRSTGELQKMSEAGWRRFDIHGFSNISAMLESYA